MTRKIPTGIINAEIQKEILDRINACEQEHNVKILFAIESGSRAWGFPSPNSDYDVRFIYTHPQAWYLDIEVQNKRDVIEYPIVDEIDINGWDIRKALMLFWQSNPAVVEWIQSPIIYVDKGVFSQRMKALMPEIYALQKGIYHYKHMATTNYREMLKKEQGSLKKYFYTLRPLLAIQWIEANQQPAPIEFDRLKTLIADDKELTLAIEQLLAQKKISTEKTVGAKIPVIDNFIERELMRLEGFAENPERKQQDKNVLNSLFRELIQ